ncbi:MAG: chemotaxis protein CheA [Gemmatimonadales bacterium]
MAAEGNAFAELLQDYVAECLPMAETVADAFVALEREWEAGNSADEILEPLKGTLHTIKGNSAMMGLTPIQGLAHGLEDLHGLLSHAPQARVRAAPLLVEGGGLLVQMIRRASSGSVTSELVDPFLAAAQGFLEEAAEISPTSAAPGLTSEVADRRRSGRRATDWSTGGAVETIRIDAKRLDALLEIFGETMIAQLALGEARQRIRKEARGSAGLEDLDRSVVQLEKSLRGLGGALMEARLLPISTVFGRFGRLVRDLAHSERKRVRVETTGGDTRLDKTLIDRLSEPLVHLVTNAVIHGIEPAEERERSGKPAEACITLAAAPRSDRVVVTVRDDGRGLDPERILRKARALGVTVSSDAPEEIFALAFLPGLSTAERVSNLSGRGVGLDVVATAIRAVSGSVDVSSLPGQGTTFTLTLPLTLVVLRALIVTVDGERYAVPLNDVAETMRIAPDAVHEIDGRGMMLWRGGLIPVSDGGALVGSGIATGGPRAYCVVVQSAAKRHALLVDRLLGRQDVVVKPLDSALRNPPVVSGATILGDGRVACILDTTRITEPKVFEPSMAGAGGRA